jgi:hypothetical protein
VGEVVKSWVLTVFYSAYHPGEETRNPTPEFDAQREARRGRMWRKWNPTTAQNRHSMNRW